LYWTCDQGLWSPSVGSDDNVKQFQRHNHQVKSWSNQAADYVAPYVAPYVKQVQDKVEIPDLKSYWNCGIRLTFRTIADFDPYQESKRFVKWVMTYTTTSPTSAESKESTASSSTQVSKK
jgi:hypothetical protein